MPSFIFIVWHPWAHSLHSAQRPQSFPSILHVRHYIVFNMYFDHCFRTTFITWRTIIKLAFDIETLLITNTIVYCASMRTLLYIFTAIFSKLSFTFLIMFTVIYSWRKTSQFSTRNFTISSIEWTIQITLFITFSIVY